MLAGTAVLVLALPADTKSGMAFLGGILALVLLPIAAMDGASYRGAYLATAIITMVLGVSCVQLTPTERDLLRDVASGDSSRIAGAQFLSRNGYPFAILWLMSALGGVLGATLFRKH